MARIIDLARDFTPTPGGRYEADGLWSAEEFRRVLLTPALSTGDAIVVDLDGAVGFASSFLEEAFGGLVREHGPEVVERVTVRATERSSRAEAAQCFMTAAARNHAERGTRCHG